MSSNEKSFVSQYCLDVQPVGQFIKDLPKRIKVVEIIWKAYMRRNRRRLEVPAYLKRLGLLRCWTTDSDVDIQGKFTNMKREQMIKAMSRILRSYKLDEKKAVVYWVTVTDGKNECSFKRMYKQIRLPNDKRKKKLVLGLAKSKGNSQNILAALSAKKITCTLMKVEKTIVMCSEEVVVE